MSKFIEKGKTITINESEFSEIASKVIADEILKHKDGGVILGMAFTIFITKLHLALFDIEADNG